MYHTLKAQTDTQSWDDISQSESPEALDQSDISSLTRITGSWPRYNCIVGLKKLHESAASVACGMLAFCIVPPSTVVYLDDIDIDTSRLIEQRDYVIGERIVGIQEQYPRLVVGCRFPDGHALLS